MNAAEQERARCITVFRGFDMTTANAQRAAQMLQEYYSDPNYSIQEWKEAFEETDLDEFVGLGVLTEAMVKEILTILAFLTINKVPNWMTAINLLDHPIPLFSHTYHLMKQKIHHPSTDFISWAQKIIVPVTRQRGDVVRGNFPLLSIFVINQLTGIYDYQSLIGGLGKLQTGDHGHVRALTRATEHLVAQNIPSDQPPLLYHEPGLLYQEDLQKFLSSIGFSNEECNTVMFDVLLLGGECSYWNLVKYRNDFAAKPPPHSLQTLRPRSLELLVHAIDYIGATTSDKQMVDKVPSFDCTGFWASVAAKNADPSRLL